MCELTDLDLEPGTVRGLLRVITVNSERLLPWVEKDLQSPTKYMLIGMEQKLRAQLYSRVSSYFY